MKEYPTSLAACEKKATMMTLTWPMRAVMASAPYRNGMLLRVPTVTVIPVQTLMSVMTQGLIADNPWEDEIAR